MARVSSKDDSDRGEANETLGADEPHDSTATDATPTDPDARDGAGSGREVALADDADVDAATGGRAADPATGSNGGRLGGLWSVLVVGSLITILILVFVLQNSDTAQVQFLNWSFSLPLGVLILFSSIAGALVMAAFAGVRILQLRMRAHRAARLRRRATPRRGN